MIIVIKTTITILKQFLYIFLQVKMKILPLMAQIWMMAPSLR